MTLDADVHEETSKMIASALGMIKGVISVEPVVSDVELHMVRERVRHELRNQMWQVLSARQTPH